MSLHNYCSSGERSGEYLQLVTTITDYVVMSFWVVVVLWYFLKCHSDEFKFKCVEDFLICSPFYHVLATLGLEDAGVWLLHKVFGKEKVEEN